MTDYPHTFNDGYFCKADGEKLNDKQENRSGACEIIDRWRKCDECMYFGKREV